MSVTRIENIDLDHRGMLTAIFGMNNASEVFITKDMRIHNMREILYLYLKEQGYIPVFYDDKAFSYEEWPLLRLFSFTPRPKDQPVPPRRDFFTGKGPMARTRATSEHNAQQHEATESHHDSIHVESEGNQRRFIVNQSEAFFTTVHNYVKGHNGDKLAIVLVMPETFEMDMAAQVKWNDLKSNFDRNRLGLRVINLYNVSPEQFVKEFQASDSVFNAPILDDFPQPQEEGAEIKPKGRPKTVYYLGAPERDEISSMLNRRRLLANGGLSNIFHKTSWDDIVLRLWQKAASNEENTPHLISEYLKYDDMDATIDGINTTKAIDKLNSLEGIDNIRDQFALYRQALARHRAGNGSGRFRPHMALMGSPGTGKTTVARLFGDILREDGLLPKGQFIKVTAGDLIAGYVGQTRIKTAKICEQARGGVLFLDEAYGLMSGNNDHGDADFGKEAIEVLIQFMEDNDDSLVILAGYTNEINDLIDNGNQGFRRRFNDLGLFEFHDYSAEVLYNIAHNMIRVPATDAFFNALRGIIRYKWAYRNKKFGNVGEIENLVNLIESQYLSFKTTEPLDVRHLPHELRILVDETMLDSDTLLAELKDIIGQEGVKELITELFDNVLADRIMLQNIEGFTPKMPKLNFIFKGNPGTGKTTIARIIGEILQRLGIFPPTKGKVVTERSGNDLLQYSPADMKALFEANIGKMLFVDEAYLLLQSPRVVGDIIQNIELAEFKNKISVVLAGYPQEIQQLIESNPGFARRFQEIQFTDYTNEQLYEILCRKVAQTPNITMDTESCRKAGMRYFSTLERGRNFGNAGEAENLLDRLIKNLKRRYVRASAEQRANKDFAERILPCDFPGYEQVVSHAASDSLSNPSENPGKTAEVKLDREIDCALENDSDRVRNGSDIYASVGLIENGNSMGTGFIISIKNRYIMTASHVVEYNRKFTFTLNMGNGIHRSSLNLLWNNPTHDLAILQADSLPSDAKFFALDSRTPRDPGSALRIVAFPHGLEVSNKAILTSGAIANYENNLSIVNENGSRRKFNAIRTEAQATHGSSGGPVVFADSMAVMGVLHGGINKDGFFMNVASDISQLLEEAALRIRF